jgi:hypothetical protein
MPICDYFSAADDQAAVAVPDTLGGPSRASLDVVALKNIDPVVCMAQLEAIMAGCSYEEARQRPRSGQLLSSPEGEGACVVSVSETLCELLAVATGDDLARAAELWSQTQELRSIRADAETVAGVMADLAGLARSAQASNRRLYCGGLGRVADQDPHRPTPLGEQPRGLCAHLAGCRDEDHLRSPSAEVRAARRLAGR